MKTYITDSQIDLIVQNIESYITPELRAKLKELKKKYGIEFYHDRQTNMNLFWLMVIDEIDKLPSTDYYKQSLISADLWNVHKNRNDVIFKYMDIKGYKEDYKYLSNLQTRDLEFYIEWEIMRKYYLPAIKISELLKMDNYRKHYQQYSKQYADKEALEYTTKLKGMIDSIYLGLSDTERVNLDAKMWHYLSLKPDLRNFDTLHTLLHKPF